MNATKLPSANGSRVSRFLATLTMTIEVITPEMAKQWLAMSGGNRFLRPRRIARYVADIQHGKWHITHQGIAFDVDGVLRDGHHRLKAIVESGCAVSMPVFRNVPKEGLSYIDAGLARSAGDALEMSGKGRYTTRHLAVARGITSFPGREVNGDKSPEDVLDDLHAHFDAIAFAMQHLGENARCISRAARILTARAWYSSDRDRLVEFCHILKTGLGNGPQDSAAVTYRNALMKLGTSSGSEVEMIKYQKGQVSLRSFLKGEPQMKCYGSEIDLFPLKSDEE